MRKPLVVANWKMNGSKAENDALVSALKKGWSKAFNSAICPPSIYIAQVAGLIDGSGIELGAQDLSEQAAGAYTGDISASMLLEYGCRFAIVGHSERRSYHAENNGRVAAKFKAAAEAGLTPILCVGESLGQRNNGQTLTVVADQLDAVTTLVSDTVIASAVIAYEPIWAIGTGLTATPEQAQEVHRFIRERLGSAGQAITLLYGGSVKADNAAELFQQPDIDGALVGGASLIADEFLTICQAAKETATKA